MTAALEELRTIPELCELLDYDEAAARPTGELQRADELIWNQKPEEAVEIARAELQQAQTAGAHAVAVMARMVMAKAEQALCTYRDATASAAAAVAAARDLPNNRDLLGAASHRLAKVYLQAGEREAAVGAATEALDHYGAAVNSDGQASVRNTLARIHLLAEDTAETMRCCNDALTVFKASNNMAGEIASLTTESRIQYVECQWVQAVFNLERARAKVREANDEARDHVLALLIAEVRLASGEFEVADNLAMLAARFFKAAGHQRRYASAMLVASMAAARRSQYEDALTRGEKALASLEDLGDERSDMLGVATICKVLSWINSSIKQHQSASDRAEYAAEVYADLDDIPGQVGCLVMAAQANLAAFHDLVISSDMAEQDPDAQASERHVQSAITFAKRALKACAAKQDFSSAHYASALRCLAKAQGNSGELREARRSIEEALDIFSRMDSKKLECAHTIVVLGEIAYHAGEFAMAIEKWREASIYYQEEQDTQGFFFCNEMIRSAYWKSGQGAPPGRDGRNSADVPFRQGPMPQNDTTRLAWDLPEQGKVHALFEHFAARQLQVQQPRQVQTKDVPKDVSTKKPWAFYTRMMPVETQ
mmetsp:Transcript_20225/g.47194  ORF Transcript_20225/g.47194 Transcript_20225/m.47194 type:complete len:598 (-) Transcript_20225:1-1794(-)